MNIVPDDRPITPRPRRVFQISRVPELTHHGIIPVREALYRDYIHNALARSVFDFEVEQFENYNQYRYLMFTLPILHNARCIAETGLGRGHSTNIHLEALSQLGGRRELHTFELSPQDDVVQQISLKKRTAKWNLHTGDSSELPKQWSSYCDLAIDYLYIDSLHTYGHVAAELSAFEPFLAPSCMVVGDDTVAGEKISPKQHFYTKTPDKETDAYWAIHEWGEKNGYRELLFSYPGGKIILYK